jgi:hypothetical protein
MSIEVAVSRLAAADAGKRHGVLLLNPGGPALPGLDIPGTIICGDAEWSHDVDDYATRIPADRETWPLTAGMPANIWACAFWEPPVGWSPAAPGPASPVAISACCHDPRRPPAEKCCPDVTRSSYPKRVARDLVENSEEWGRHRRRGGGAGMRLRDWYDLEEEHEAWPPPQHAGPAAELERRLRERSELRRTLVPLMRQLQALEHTIRRLPPGSALRAELRHKMNALNGKARPRLVALRLLNHRIRMLSIVLSTPVTRGAGQP